MDFDCFKDFPDSARVWIYAFPQNLDGENLAIVDATLDEFCAGWKSHDDPVTGRYAIYKNRFVVIAGVIDGGPSGCSIDSSVRVFKTLQQEHGLNALDDMLVHYQKDGRIVSATRAAFGESCRNGEISPDTIVYNCALQHLGEVRAGTFECRFADSWHAAAFNLG